MGSTVLPVWSGAWRWTMDVAARRLAPPSDTAQQLAHPTADPVRVVDHGPHASSAGTGVEAGALRPDSQSHATRTSKVGRRLNGLVNLRGATKVPSGPHIDRDMTHIYTFNHHGTLNVRVYKKNAYKSSSQCCAHWHCPQSCSLLLFLNPLSPHTAQHTRYTIHVCRDPRASVVGLSHARSSSCACQHVPLPSCMFVDPISLVILKMPCSFCAACVHPYFPLSSWFTSLFRP